MPYKSTGATPRYHVIACLHCHRRFDALGWYEHMCIDMTASRQWWIISPETLARGRRNLRRLFVRLLAAIVLRQELQSKLAHLEYRPGGRGAKRACTEFAAMRARAT